MLRYFYDRNGNATSTRGKKGSSVKISDVKRELRTSHELTQQEVQSNLTYLISQGWVKEDVVEKSYTAPSGTVIPSTTHFYTITAPGIDKIEGPGEFTMTKFHGIKIEATGQNIITLGDGNQINAKFGELGQSLSELRSAITSSRSSRVHKTGTGGRYRHNSISASEGRTQPNNHESSVGSNKRRCGELTVAPCSYTRSQGYWRPSSKGIRELGIRRDVPRRAKTYE